MKKLVGRFLRRLSIKNFLMGTISILLLALTVLSINNVLNARKTGREIARLDTANMLADKILEASGYEAKERGVTSEAITSSAAADDSIIRMIQELRSKGDDTINKAYELAKKLAEMDGANPTLDMAVRKAQALHSELESARRNADRNFGRTTNKDYSAKDYTDVITSYIDANADIRTTAFTSSSGKETLQEALRMNLELKHAVWLVSEYAGRERAILARFVSSRIPFEKDTLEKLNTYRAIVDINLRPILRFKDSKDTDPEVLAAVSKMEEVFLGSFEGLRKSVYAGGSAGNYPVSGKEWVDNSSAAINTILDVSAAVGKMVDDRIVPDLRASRRSMTVSIIVLALIVTLGMASLFVIKSKVVSPMLFLNDRMSAIEKSGDLTVKIDVTSEDESGQMADTFNKMMSKFHDIVREIHSSVDYLASSSEELSASATQIAGGSQAQSAKAAQVSTASQEMSATITEVAKNVSSASDAAKEANGVAVKGGDIVSKTIESMNGISKTARESSEIISTLGNRSHEIGNIINVIDDIADQTNLLALNAAIEAARAGEQGRGFAVVADEVRKLAEKTMKATKEIGDMINAMQNETQKAITSMESEVTAVNTGAKLAEEAGGALKEIVDKVSVVTSMIHNITTALEQQSAATEQISGDIESVSDVIAETSKSAQQIAGASNEIAKLAAGLKTNVEIFKVSRSKKEMKKVRLDEPEEISYLERPAFGV